LDVTYFSKKLSRVRVTIDGVCNGNWIYWPFTERN
jgi:hypothetical protein